MVDSKYNDDEDDDDNNDDWKLLKSWIEFNGVAVDVILIEIGSTNDAQINMSIRLVSPTIVIVKMAAIRRNKWMSLKRLLILMIVSEKYWKFRIKSENIQSGPRNATNYLRQ